MEELSIGRIRTDKGDLPVNYTALANKPITRVESLDEDNLATLRDLDSGLYILYGYFRPFPGSPDTITYDNALVSVAKLDEGSHVLVFTPLNFRFFCEEVLVDADNARGYTYTRETVSLLDLNALLKG